MSASEYASEISTSYLENRLSTSIAALTVYEYAITFDQEVSSVWRRKKTAPAILLLVMRWAMVLQICVIFASAETPGGCEAVAIIQNVVIALTSTMIAALSGLRAYALWGRNRTLFVTTFLLEFTGVVVNLYSLNGVYRANPVFGCVEHPKYSLKTQITLIRITRIPAIIGDALVVGATWMKSFQQLCEGRRLGMPLPLSTLLLRDGTIYFLLLFIVNILELCPNLPAEGDAISFIAVFLPPILLNRFMLNLRQLSEVDAESGGHLRTISTPMFRVSVNVAGNMGEPLEFGGEREDDLDADEGPREHGQALVDDQDVPASVRDSEGGLDAA